MKRDYSPFTKSADRGVLNNDLTYRALSRQASGVLSILGNAESDCLDTGHEPGRDASK